MISAQKVSKKFGDIQALTDITFKIESGDFVFLTGPSGSGKSTLLKLLLRDLTADTGSMSVDGQDLAKISASKLFMYRRQIGVVFQDFKLLADRSVAENVSLPMEIVGAKPDVVEKRVLACLKMVELENKAKLFPAQLSGGELQRVVIARAIINGPKLVLADEPTGNLDPKTSLVIIKLLRQIHSELKATVIVATHNVDIVNKTGARVISLADGKLVNDVAKGKYE